MPWITNISLADVYKGNYPSPQGDQDLENCILIQIQDKGCKFVEPACKDCFQEIHQFNFDDLDHGPNVISDEQAEKIAQVLKSAFDKSLNVIVHCHMGLCRSGAVTECGVLFGFEDIHKNKRIPNLKVKSKIRRKLGILNSWE